MRDLLRAAALPLLALSPVTPALALDPGDIAFIAFNADGDDDVAFVALADIPADSLIYFTEEEWSNLNGGEWPPFASEATFTWSHTEVVPAGTVVTLNNLATMDGLTPNESASIGTINWLGGSAAFSAGSDALYAFEVAGAPGGTYPTPSGFLAMVANSTTSGDVPTTPDTLSEAAGTAVRFNGGVDAARYIGPRNGEAAFADYLALIANPANWENVGTSADGTVYLPFDTTAFVTGGGTPTLGVEIAAASVSEDAGASATTLTVSRSGSTDGTLSVDLVSSDPGEAAVQATVNFAIGESSVTGIPVDAVDDTVFDGTQSVTITASATGVNPGNDSLEVTDDLADNPGLIVNELHASATADINGDRLTNAGDDFVELVNTSGGVLDISGWSIADTTSTRHVFAAGTVLDAGCAILVFDQLPVSPGNLAGTLAVAASSGGLGLGTSDTLTVSDATPTVVSVLAFNATSGASLNLATESLPSAYVEHASVSGSGGSLLSPGTLVDGSAFCPSSFLTLSASPSGFDENVGAAASTITLTITPPSPTLLVVTLASTDTSEASVQATLEVPAMQGSITFPVDAVDDATLDTVQRPSISATAAGYFGGATTLEVFDDGDLVPAGNLATGDIAFIGFNADGDDDLAFVTLSPIDSGQVIRFTDNEWLGSAFDISEDTANWTAPLGGVAAGQVVVLGGLSTPTPTASIGDVDSGLNLSAAGEVVTAYQSLIEGEGIPTFLAQVGTTTSETLSGTNLVGGTHAVFLPDGTRGGAYNGPRSGVADFAGFLPLIGDAATHWLGNSSDGTLFLPFDATPFSADFDLDAWKTANGLGGAADDSDDDLDGIALIIEYALDLDPNAADLPPGTFAGGTLSFQKNPDAVAAGDITWIIEASPNLAPGSWAAVGATVDNSTTIAYDLPTGPGSLFARLRVARTAP